MATLTKRKTGWFVQIRRKGYEPEYRTLPTKAEAEKWARERESRIDQGLTSANARELRQQTLGDLIRRYLDEVTPKKASADSERLRLTKMLSAPMCAISLHDLTSAPISDYRDTRAATVKPGTVAREIGLLHNIREVARRDWGVGLSSNVVAQVRRLPIRNARDRRLQSGEMERLSAALATTRNKLVAPAVLFAIETAMRRG